MSITTIVLLIFMGVFLGIFSIVEFKGLNFGEKRNTLLKNSIFRNNVDEVMHQLEEQEQQKETIFTQLDRQLRQAEMGMKSSIFLTIMILLAIIAILFTYSFRPSPIIAAAVGVAGGATPLYFVKKKRETNILKFNNSLSKVCDRLAKSISAGETPHQAILEIAKGDFPHRVLYEFEQVNTDIGMNFSIQDSLNRLYERVGSEDLHILAVSVDLNLSAGGDLATIIKQIGETIEERKQQKQEMKSLTASQRSSGTMLAIIPFGVIGFFMLINPGYFEPVWSSSFGTIIFSIFIGMIVIGTLITRRMTNIDL